jgi:hypothetical protein
MNSTGIKLAVGAAVGAPWPFALSSRTKTRRKRKRKETCEESIALKYAKAKRRKLNATEIRII